MNKSNKNYKSNKSSMQNITVSNLLNYLESLNYVTLRASHLPEKLKFWKERKFGNNTLSE